MEKYLNENEIFELAYEKLNIANPNVNKAMEYAEMMGLEYDEKENEYINPDYIKNNIVVNVSSCYECDPVTASKTLIPSVSANYLCKCGNKYSIPTKQTNND